MHIELTTAEFREVFGCNLVTIKATWWAREINEDCEGCKYLDKDENEYPCKICKHSHRDMYEKGGD